MEAGELTGEFRFICDMRHLNDHVIERPFRYQQLNSIPVMAEPSDRATCCDLSDFFYSFPVSERDQHYFTVRAPPTLPLNTDPTNPPYVPNALYVFTGLPMGYRLSPYVACKSMKWIAAWVRERKGWLVSFVDDNLLGASPRRIRALTEQYRALLRDLGFKIHPSKGWSVGKRRFVFLGIGVDLAMRIWFAPAYKLSKLRQACERTLHHIHAHSMTALPRILARLGGLAMSLLLPSPTMPLYTRSSWDALRGVNWRSKQAVHCPPQLREDLKAISSLTRIWVSSPFKRGQATATLYTDASIRGFGGWGTVDTDPDTATRVATVQLDELAGYWTDGKHVSGQINLLELRAVILAIRANHHQLAGRTVQLWTDNRSVMAVVNSHRSRAPTLMIEYRELFQLLTDHKIQLCAAWIDTVANVRADTLSRAKDPTEFRWSPELVQMAQKEWSVQLTHDCFAAPWCHQPHMAWDSRWATADANSIDTMLTSWKGKQCWWTPPWNFVAETLMKIERDQASGVLLTPDWPSAPWYRRAELLAQQRIVLAHAHQYAVPVTNNLAEPEPMRNNRWGCVLWRIAGCAT